jgi:hypothetical protein
MRIPHVSDEDFEEMKEIIRDLRKCDDVAEARIYTGSAKRYHITVSARWLPGQLKLLISENTISIKTIKVDPDFPDHVLFNFVVNGVSAGRGNERIV